MKDRTAYMISVMQAYVDGKSIESLYYGQSNNVWGKEPHPEWDWRMIDYRVASDFPSTVYFDGEKFYTEPSDTSGMRKYLLEG